MTDATSAWVSLVNCSARTSPCVLGPRSSRRTTVASTGVRASGNQIASLAPTSSAASSEIRPPPMDASSKSAGTTPAEVWTSIGIRHW
jgi:hypothetical protein